MSIINITNNDTPLTPTQQLAKTAGAYKSQIDQQYQAMARLFGTVKDFVWKDPAKAQDRFTAFGTDAADLVKVSAAFAALVETYTGSAPAILPDGYSLTPNADGTVTVVAPTPAPTASK